MMTPEREASGNSQGAEKRRSSEEGLVKEVSDDRGGDSVGVVEDTANAVDSVEEGRQIGHVQWSIYGTYIFAIGPMLTSVIVASLILMQVVKRIRCFENLWQGRSGRNWDSHSA